MDAFRPTDDNIITWPSIIALLLVLLYFLPRYILHNNLSEETQQGNKMIVKPQDGTVRVSEIFIHLIKSCRGTSVQSANYTPEGIEHDRKYCLIDAKTNTILTARQVSKVVLITPRIEGENIIVSFPGGSGCRPFTVPLEPTPETLASWKLIDKISFFTDKVDGYIAQTISPSLPPSSPSDVLSMYFGKPVHLVYKGPRVRAVNPTHEFPELKASSVYQDMYPLLVLSEESMGVVEEEVRQRVGTMGVEEIWKEEKVQLRRFRPNIVLSGGGPFAEDNWEEITIGDNAAPKITLVSKCARCLLPNVSPDTGERDKAVPYKVIAKFRTGLDPLDKLKPCVGSNGVPEASGVIRIGDVVYVKKMIGEVEEPEPVTKVKIEAENGEKVEAEDQSQSTGVTGAENGGKDETD